MAISRAYPIIILLLLTQSASCARASTHQPQDKDFTSKIVDLTLSEISDKGPSREAAGFVSRSMDLLWPKRRELLKVTAPYLDSTDSSKAAAAMDILYRLRSYHRMPGLGFSEAAWQKENSDFREEVDAFVYQRLDRLLASRDSGLLKSLALYLGSSAPTEVSKKALLQLAINPEMGEQALICLTWHKDKRDMDDLLPFMLRGGREASGLPYQFRNSYGAASLPYLLKALDQASSPFVRLQAAEQLIFMNDKSGVKYLYEAVLHRNELPNGTAQAEEIRQFAISYMGLPKERFSMDDLLKFLRAKLSE